MAIEAMMVVGDSKRLVPATEHDSEQLEGLKLGKPLKVTITSQTERSLKHHRLFFGGLLKMGFEYWEPAGGLITAGESKGIMEFAKYLDRTRNSTVIQEVAELYLQRLAQVRAEKIQAPSKDPEQFRKWVIIEAGYFDLKLTPSGPVKVAKSISFRNMSQEEFNKLYKASFSVIWRMVLSHHFETEAECQSAIDQLCAMG